MKVSLVSITQPLIKTEDGSRNLTAEELIVYCARVSNPKNQLNTETAPGLIKYCIAHQHWSIFEQCCASFEIVTSRAVSAQLIRHKSLFPQEFSARYSKVQNIEPIELRKQGATNRQVGDEIFDPIVNNMPLTEDSPVYASDLIESFLEDAKYLYDRLIEEGIAKECARMIMPMASQTTLYVNGTVRSWIHYLQLRTKEDTQKEHREVALEIQKIFIQQFPEISKALEWA